VLGLLALAAFGTSAITGFLSHAAYNPDLGGNAIVPRGGDLPLNFDWPTGPSWLYAVTQGLHVTIGIAAIPILVAKLWSVMPRLFQFPPVRSPAEAIERLSIGLFVSSSVFLLATGVCNVFYYYPFDFNFVVAHYYAAVIFTASLLVHLVVKMPIVIRKVRERGLIAPLRVDLAHTEPEPYDPDDDVRALHPADPTMSRRGLIGFAVGGSALLTVSMAGQSIGGPLREVAFLAPRRGGFGDGPNDFAVNKTARAAGITSQAAGPAYRLELVHGAKTVSLSRQQLLALAQQTEDLPIACVEGWSTTQSWTGVPLALLAQMAGGSGSRQVLVESLQPRGVLRKATLSHDQFSAGRALLALKVNGADLSPDHGYPARIIVPALPGVHNTKWVARMTFS
jgi:DMSO/TMAO reductase YedYZ molybdopterin-dependent catalytic subunit